MVHCQFEWPWVLSDLKWLKFSEIFNDTEHHARDLSATAELLVTLRCYIRRSTVTCNGHSYCRKSNKIRLLLKFTDLWLTRPNHPCKLSHCSTQCLTLYSAKAIIVPHRIIWSWYTGRWWVGCFIWYSHNPPKLLLAVCTKCHSHPSTASVPIMVLLSCIVVPCSAVLMCPLKG